MQTNEETVPEAIEDEAQAPGPEAGPGSEDEPETADPQTAALEAATAERDKLKEQLMRSVADFENYKRRSRREVEEAEMRGKDRAVSELLPVFDNLERAVNASTDAKDVQSLVEGVRMVLKLFEDTAERMGLNRVKSVGERFDPAVHDAIQQLETDEHPPGTIIAEVAPGYLFGKRLLRAAMVVVARAKSTQEPAASQAPTEADESKSTPPQEGE